MKRIFHGLSVLVLLGTAMPAMAQQETRQASVGYSDLNLANPLGIKALEGRVSSAARQVCANGDFSLQEKLQQNDCMRRSYSKATSDVNDAIRRAKTNSISQSRIRSTVATSSHLSAGTFATFPSTRNNSTSAASTQRIRAAGSVRR